MSALKFIFSRRFAAGSSKKLDSKDKEIVPQPNDAPYTENLKKGNDITSRIDETLILTLTPEMSAEDHFLARERDAARGTFSPVSETSTGHDDKKWEFMPPTETDNPYIGDATEPSKAKTSAPEEELDFRLSGALPSIAVRSMEANELKAAIGGEAANLNLCKTISVVGIARAIRIPVVLAGKGLLKSNEELSETEYAVSTLGSRSSSGNFIHALVISPVLLVDEILSSKMGHIWLASIIRKEQLLVSYRPIRGASSCEDLASRAKSMPTDAESIIAKQRGLGLAPNQR